MGAAERVRWIKSGKCEGCAERLVQRLFNDRSTGVAASLYIGHLRRAADPVNLMSGVATDAVGLFECALTH